MAISTIQDIIEESYSKHGVPEPSAVELQRGLDLSNNIILSINTELALDTPISTFATLATSFGLTFNWRRYLIAQLAYDLGENLDSKTIETLYKTAQDEKETLRREYLKQVDDGDVTTSKELLLSSFRALGNPHPTTNELDHSLSVCNNLIQTWNKEFGLDTPIAEFTDLTTTLSSISMGDEWKRPLILATAVDLAFIYNLEAKIQFLQPFALENKLLLKNLNSRFVTDFEADTVKELLISAFRMAGKPNPDTNELNHALGRMNSMIATWAKEFCLNYTETFTSLADSIATYPLHWREPLEYNMAVKIAESFPGTQIAPTVFRTAQKLRRELDIKELVDIADSRLDDMLDPIYQKGGEATDININD